MFSIEKDGRRQLFSEFPKKNIIREFPFVKMIIKDRPSQK